MWCLNEVEPMQQLCLCLRRSHICKVFSTQSPGADGTRDPCSGLSGRVNGDRPHGAADTSRTPSVGGSAPGISRSTCEHRVGVFLCVKATDVSHAQTGTSAFAFNAYMIIANCVPRVSNTRLVGVQSPTTCAAFKFFPTGVSEC